MDHFIVYLLSNHKKSNLAKVQVRISIDNYGKSSVPKLKSCFSEVLFSKRQNCLLHIAQYYHTRYNYILIFYTFFSMATLYLKPCGIVFVPTSTTYMAVLIL